VQVLLKGAESRLNGQDDSVTYGVIDREYYAGMKSLSIFPYPGTTRPGIVRVGNPRSSRVSFRRMRLSQILQTGPAAGPVEPTMPRSADVRASSGASAPGALLEFAFHGFVAEPLAAALREISLGHRIVWERLQ